jgi:hypothetical protein
MIFVKPYKVLIAAIIKRGKRTKCTACYFLFIETQVSIPSFALAPNNNNKLNILKQFLFFFYKRSLLAENRSYNISQQTNSNVSKTSEVFNMTSSLSYWLNSLICPT